MSLEILVHAYYGRSEGYVHHYGDGVRSEEGVDAFLLEDGAHALTRCEVTAELQPLLDH